MNWFFTVGSQNLRSEGAESRGIDFAYPRRISMKEKSFPCQTHEQQIIEEMFLLLRLTMMPVMRSADLLGVSDLLSESIERVIYTKSGDRFLVNTRYCEYYLNKSSGRGRGGALN